MTFMNYLECYLEIKTILKRKINFYKEFYIILIKNLYSSLNLYIIAVALLITLIK